MGDIYTGADKLEAYLEHHRKWKDESGKVPLRENKYETYLDRSGLLICSNIKRLNTC